MHSLGADGEALLIEWNAIFFRGIRLRFAALSIRIIRAMMIGDIGGGGAVGRWIIPSRMRIFLCGYLKLQRSM